MTYLTAIERTHDNPLTGKAGYRVSGCGKNPFFGRKKLYWYGQWHLVTNRRHKIGTFINLRQAIGIPKRTR